MKRILWMTCLAGWMTVAAFGGETTYSDNFNDGVRDKAFWKIHNNYGAKLVEGNGRLYAYSGVLDPLNDYHSITWLQKPAINLVNHDVLEIEAALRLPMLPIGAAADAYFDMHLGFTVPDSSPQKRVFVVITRNQSGRHYNFNVFKPDGTSTGWSVVPPGNGSKYIFKMRYNTVGGSVTLWCRTDRYQPWTKLKIIDVNTSWLLWPGSPITLQGFVSFTSYKTRVNEPSYIYFDNYKVTHIRP